MARRGNPPDVRGWRNFCTDLYMIKKLVLSKLNGTEPQRSNHQKDNYCNAFTTELRVLDNNYFDLA